MQLPTGNVGRCRFTSVVVVMTSRNSLMKVVAHGVQGQSKDFHKRLVYTHNYTDVDHAHIHTQHVIHKPAHTKLNTVTHSHTCNVMHTHINIVMHTHTVIQTHVQKYHTYAYTQTCTYVHTQRSSVQ